MSGEIKIRGDGGEVTFKVRPKITVTKDAVYENPGLPGNGMQTVYRVTNNKKYAFSAKFVSRNADEATENFLSIRLLDSWLTTTREKSAQPSHLFLNGYGDVFYNIPLVMTSINIPYDDEVDYIEGFGIWQQIVTTISFSLVESHTTESLKSYNIDQFRQGLLDGF